VEPLRSPSGFPRKDFMFSDRLYAVAQPGDENLSIAGMFYQGFLQQAGSGLLSWVILATGWL